MKCPRCQVDNSETSRYCAGCGAPLSASGSPAEDKTRTLPPLPKLETGTLFAGRYQVIEKIGSGGMGQVFKVFDTKVQERVALKIIRPEISSDPKTIERFGHELRAARRIAHRNVCRMFDLGEHAGTHYITMEYVAGETLKNIIRMSGPLSIGSAVDYAKQIADGLEEARRFGIIHRDLKPQNVLIDPSHTARIMDFGIARSLQSGEWTAEGVVLGTPEYMSPEQAEGEEADHRSDLYSLGMILYEMVTGKTPFESRTPLGVLVKQKSESPRSPRQLNPQVPESLAAVILKCLAKDRNQRFQTAADVRAALGKLEATGLLPTARPEVVSGSGPTAPRPKRLRATAAVLLLGAALAGMYFLFRPRPVGRPPLPAAKAEPAKASLSIRTSSVAVLPFVVRAPGSSPSGLGYDLAQGIRQKLMSLRGLKVSDQYESDQYRALADRPAEIGQALQVEYIVVGAIELASSLLRLDLRLIRTRGEAFEVEQRYEDKRDGPFLNLEERVANDIARQLKMTYVAAQESRPFSIEPADPETRTLMIGAKKTELRYRDQRLPADFDDAARLYRQVIGRDRTYPLSYLGLGNLYESRYATGGGNPDDCLEMVLNYQMAFKKNPGVAETNAGMGWVYYYEPDWDKAYQSFARAYELAPDNAEINFNFGSFLRSIGLDDKATWYYGRALTLDPGFHYAIRACTASYWNLGQFERGRELLEEGLKSDPDNFLLRAAYARFLVATRDLDKAGAEIQRLEKISPDTEEGRERVNRLKAWYLALQGDSAGARDILRDIKQPFRYEVTNAYLVLGEKDLALYNIKWGLDRAYYMIKDFLYPYPYFLNNPFFEGIKSDPRFQSLVAKAKAAYMEKDRKYPQIY
jgi:TolB-like protein/tRNA A-37 threonylcarbamoyl transferase component Bud32